MGNLRNFTTIIENIGILGLQNGIVKTVANFHNEKEEVQRLLNRMGYNVGEPDGAIGEKTMAAIKSFQQRIGVAPDGYANATLLKQLRSAS